MKKTFRVMVEFENYQRIKQSIQVNFNHPKPMQDFRSRKEAESAIRRWLKDHPNAEVWIREVYKA